MLRIRCMLACLATTLAVELPATANPAILDSGIIPSQSPPVPAREMSVVVEVHNRGDADADGVAVKLSWNDYGLAFSGWQFLGNQDASVPAGGTSSVSFQYTFPSRAHVKFQARIGQVQTGGDAISSDNVGIFNAHRIYSGNRFSYHVPITNPGDEDNQRTVTVRIDVRCDNGTLVDTCPFSHELIVPGMDSEGTLVLAAGDEVMGSISASLSGVDDGDHSIVVRAIDQDTGEEVKLTLLVVKTSVPALVDQPSFCCLSSVRARAALEKTLLLAKRAYARGDPKLAIQRLRQVIQGSLKQECHRGAGEVGCLEQFMLKLVDAARMVAVQYGDENPGDADKLRDGDWFRMMGLYEAAVTEYSQYFSWVPEPGAGLTQRSKNMNEQRPSTAFRPIEL